MRTFALLVFLVLVACGAGAGYLEWYAHAPIPLAAEEVEVQIKLGSSIRGTVQQLRDAGVPVLGWPFRVIARLTERDATLKAGTYLVRRGDTPLGLLERLSRGEVVATEIRLIEGWTIHQVRKALAEHPDIRQDTKGMDDKMLLSALGAAESHLEGLFFPDTYKFSKGTSDLVVLRKAYQAMKRHLSELWESRHADSPLKTPYDALILASIVEKETGRAEDRSLVSAVLLNRIKRGMRLQADPTVIYGLGDRFDGNLRKGDLKADSPYNTYTRSGLPPTPIAMPGLASLEAVVRPAHSEALYFVARGDGSSQFSRTLEEHNQAVSRYQRNAGAGQGPR